MTVRVTAQLSKSLNESGFRNLFLYSFFAPEQQNRRDFGRRLWLNSIFFDNKSLRTEPLQKSYHFSEFTFSWL